jgi:flavodoxin
MASNSKKQVVVLFDNYNRDFDEYKKDYMENNDVDDNVSEQTIWDYISELENMEWEDMLEELANIDNYKKCVAFGTAGTWQGRCDCGKIYDTIEDAINGIIKDCDYIKVWSENGHLYLKASHHDGTHNFEIKPLTYKGWEIFDSWESGYCGESLYNKSCWEVLDMLFNCNLFSKLPRVV